MILIEARELESVYRELLNLLLSRGERRESRLGPTLDLGPTAFSLTPSPLKLLANPGRALNPALAIVEACWILSGRRSVDPLAAIAPRFRKFSDDGTALAGAYGERLRHRFGFDQVASVVDHLRTDPNSRRAFALIAEPGDSRSASLDVPCNIAIMFRIVGGAVAMTVVNRSNDAIFGVPYDVFSLSLLHFTVSQELKRPLGEHLHIANSMHIYEANADLAERALAAEPVTGLPSDAEAARFMTALVEQADAIGNLDLPRVHDARLRNLLAGSLSKRASREALARLPGDDWLAALARRWSSREPSSVVVSAPARELGAR